MARLSVIIPGYNTPESWWRRCLDSVRKACSSYDEIICIDDGSKVKPDFLNEIALNDYRIKVIMLDRNQGQSAARNVGLVLATGEYVTFVDSDDIVNEDVYKRAICKSDKAKSDVVVFGVRTIWVDERLTKVDMPKDMDYGVIRPCDIKGLIDGCLFEYVWNKVYRRDFLIRNGIKFRAGYCPGEDTIFNLEVLLADSRWSSVNCEGYVYYRVDGSSLSRYQPKAAESLRYKGELLSRYKEKFPEGHDVLGKKWELTKVDLDNIIWNNAWRRGTPISLKERMKARGFSAFVLMLVRMVVRRWLYIVPLRRYNIKRNFPKVTSL